MSDTTLALTIVAPCDLFTANQQRRMHWGVRAALTQQWRFGTKLEAMNAKLPEFRHVTIEARILRRSGRKTDADAFAPVVKACIDGLVDARVLVDDGPDYVRGVIYRPAEVGGMVDAVVLMLRGELAA